MKTNIRLGTYLFLSFLAMGAVLIVSYTFLSSHFYGRGLRTVTASVMLASLEKYVDDTRPEERQGLRYVQTWQIAPRWQDMPEDVQASLHEPARENVLYHSAEGKWPLPPERVDFALRSTVQGQTYFIHHRLTPDEVSPLIGRNAMENMQILLLTSVGSALFMGIGIVLILRKAARPGKALGQWAAQLDAANLHLPPPDFYYPEHNELARLIRQSLLSVQESLAREQLFLRYSSHELRTPISVIRNSLELHEKIKDTHSPGKPDMEERILERIDRASLTMAHLTETLLWLGRTPDKGIPEAEVDMEALVQELAEEAHYLLTGKEVDVVKDTSPCTLKLPVTAARIVIGNLIRNAFQHTSRGVIHIQQRGGLVEVVNDMAGESDVRQDMGFGLGLQLLEKLTRQFGWEYRSERRCGRHCARVDLDGGQAAPGQLPPVESA